MHENPQRGKERKKADASRGSDRGRRRKRTAAQATAASSSPLKTVAPATIQDR